MEELWEQFRELPDALVCRWLIRSDEKKMVEAFLETSYQEENPCPDFFLPFYSEFVQPEEYTNQLVQELHQLVKADQEELAKEGITISWETNQADEEQERKAGYFLKLLEQLAAQVPGAELVVPVLFPVSASRKLNKWVTELLENPMPVNLRILIIEYQHEELLTKVAEKFPDQVITSVLNLDMPEAMRQLASVGNPADPGVKFRKAFLELSQAAANKNLSEVQRLETVPLLLAREQGWVTMEVAVHSLVATAYIGLNQFPKALQRYELGYTLAKKAHAAGDPVGLILAVQSLFNKGSVLIGQKEFPTAAKTYALAADLASQLGDHFQKMEAKRMQGYCLEKCSLWEEAFKAEKEALAAAELLEENIRLNSTLPYLGKALLDLAYQMGYKTQYLALEEKLNALAGPNWQSKVPTSKVHVV